MWRRYLDLLQQALRGEEQDYTTLPVNSAIFLLAIPMMLEMLMESLFALVDIFFVAKIGVNAVATVGLTESTLSLVYSLGIGLSTATTAMVARRIGEKNPDSAALTAVQAIWLGLGIGTVISVAGIWFAPDLLRLMGGSPELVKEGTPFMRITLGSNFVIILLFLFNAIFRGSGNAMSALYALVIANGFNIILDPCLIFGLGPFPALGLTGAAVATATGRLIGVCYQLWVLTQSRHALQVRREHIRLVPTYIGNLFRLMLGGAGQYLIASASWIVLMRIVSIFGANIVAGYTIAIRILIFAILPSWGVANAAATLVGQNLGAKLPERAESAAWKAAFINVLFMILLTLIFYAAAPYMVKQFNDTPAVVQEGVKALQIMCLGYIFYGIGMVLSQGINGAGDTATPTLLNFICFWLIEMPLAYLLAVTLGWQSDGVYWSIVIAESILGLLLIYVFRKGKWKTIQV